MAYKQFGNTWWGAQWLNALKQIDYSNRLPRGKSYARNNRVTKIAINGNLVKARVQGTRPSPYRVTIKLPALSKRQQKTTTCLIRQNPFYLAKLLNHQLPTQLYQTLEKHKIKLFTSKWDDLQGNCSCPDWAVPCKHLAAVIYLIANEIDNNPFAVFSLRKMDLLAAIGQTGSAAKTAKEQVIPSLKSLVQSKPEPNMVSRSANEESFNLAGIPPLAERIIALLPANPAFYPHSDFTLKVKQMFTILRRKTTKYLKNLHLDNDYFEVPAKPRIIVNNKLQFSRWRCGSDNYKSTVFRDNLAWLEKLKLTDLKTYDPYVQSLVLAWHFIIKLLQQGAVVPRLVQITDRKYRLQWLPADVNKEVKRLFIQLGSICPADLVTMQTGKTTKFFSPLEKLRLISDIFINYWLKPEVQSRLINNALVEKVFFDQQVLSADSFETQTLPQSIHFWLSKFFITHKKWQPVLKVEDVSSDRFSVSVAVGHKKESLAKPVSLKQFLSSKKFSAYKNAVLQDLTLLTDQFKDLAEVVASSGEKILIYDSIKFVEILFDILPTLKLLGIPLVLPKALDKVVRPRVTMSIKSNTPSQRRYLSLTDMLEFNWQVAIGNKKLSPEQFIKLVRQSQGIIKWRDQFIYLDQKEVTKLMKELNKPTQVSKNDLLRASLSGEYNGAPVTLSKETQKLIKQMLTIPKLKPPPALQATLRLYQQRGFAWLYHNAQLGFGSLLADDMGLGKTIQIIALLLQLKKEGKSKQKPALVIVPTSLITNWRKEIEKFAPNLSFHIYHSPYRKLPSKQKDVVLTSYGVIRLDVNKLRRVRWNAVILDEAQNIKNATTSQAKAVRQLKSNIKIALTGTPVENRLSEYWSIADFLNRGYLYSLKKFTEEFAKPIELERDQQALRKFRALTDPFIRRRVKTDKTIITDLPDKIVSDQYCFLTKQQAALYQTQVEQTMKLIEQSKGIERKGMVFKLITSLKQICNHPRQFLKKGELKPELSGKTQLLFELLDNIYQNKQKVLIFSQYTQMGELLVELITQKFKRQPLFFHGSLPRKKRDELISAFQTQPQTNTLILSLKAGGTGLNLTAATNIIHYDLWWNPAVEDQATDRAYRIGQHKAVNVYRLITQKTFEEKINTMIINKKELSDITVAVGEKWIGDLSDNELKELLKLE